ncbi:hypothetical protein EOL96_02560 [Candidatus Saccharibacteria bacterium]|nr:hypothetical protein [Candidatus Saccharibacteria bacterium]
MVLITIEGGVPRMLPAEIRIEAVSLERLNATEHPQGTLDADWRRLRSELGRLSETPSDGVYYDEKGTPYPGELEGTIYVVDTGSSLSVMLLHGVAETASRGFSSAEIDLDSFVACFAHNESFRAYTEFASVQFLLAQQRPEFAGIDYLHFMTTKDQLAMLFVLARPIA